MINWIDSYHDPQLDGYGSATKAMDPGGVDPDPYPTIKLGLDLNLEKLDHIRKMRNNQIQIRTSKNWTRSEPWETTKSGSELWKTNRIRTPSNKFTLNFFSVNLEVNIRITNYLYYNLGRWILKEKLDSNIILENFEPWFADRIRFFFLKIWIWIRPFFQMRIWIRLFFIVYRSGSNKNTRLQPKHWIQQKNGIKPKYLIQPKQPDLQPCPQHFD